MQKNGTPMRALCRGKEMSRVRLRIDEVRLMGWNASGTMGIGYRSGDYTTKAPRSSEGERRAKEFERKKEESALDETRVRDTSTAATRTIIRARSLRHTLHGEDDLSCEVHFAFRALRQTHPAHTLHVEARSLPSCMLSGNPGHQGMPPHRMPWCARGVPQER